MDKSLLQTQLQELFELLQKTEPMPDELDVAWRGPYFIPRKRLWGATRFSIYRGTLFCAVWLQSEYYGMKWNLKTGVVEIDAAYRHGEYSNDESLWLLITQQLITRMKQVLASPETYNRRVDTRLPPACRTGKIRRALTWQKSRLPRATSALLKNLEAELRTTQSRPQLKAMCAQDYLDTVGIAYDAVFPDLKSLDSQAKYKARADGRHGGLLGLPKKNARAFKTWFDSRTWAGTHPFEIVFGHPHGIMLYPVYEQADGTWHYSLSVSSEGFYLPTAQMAIALSKAGVCFEFYRSDEIIQALRGQDLVEVGFDSRSVWYDELVETNPDSLKHIVWDPLPKLSKISEPQRLRLQTELASIEGLQD